MPNPENLTRTGGFQKNPKNINRNGRPRKSFATINAELKEKGVEPLTKSQLLEAYALVFNSTEAELKGLAKSKDTPYAMKIIILELNSSRTRSKALADYRDYIFGKAAHTIGITAKGSIQIEYVNVSKQFDDKGNPIKEDEE